MRTVEIVGLDLQADGGTHVGNTREVGGMKVVDYKSKARLISGFISSWRNNHWLENSTHDSQKARRLKVGVWTQETG
ncbi:MAG: hypothetical protein R3A44_25415 [Caldilineaceae bacterium]